MKRVLQNYAGGPLFEKSTSDVVGRPVTRSITDVASFLDGMRREPVDSEAQIADEFAEFLAAGEDSRTANSSASDPIFREKLRRRLWRLHLLVHPPASGDPH